MKKVFWLAIIILCIVYNREVYCSKPKEPSLSIDTIVPVDTAKYIKYRHRKRDTTPYKGNWIDKN